MSGGHGEADRGVRPDIIRAAHAASRAEGFICSTRIDSALSIVQRSATSLILFCLGDESNLSQRKEPRDLPVAN
jgi:hypothetical protein